MIYIDSDEIPLVDYGNNKIIRCDRCKSFLSPFTKFQDFGNKMKCALCQTEESIPKFYFSNLDETGVRKDINERIELTNSYYDIAAGKEYFKINSEKI